MGFWNNSLRTRLVTYFSALSLVTVGGVGVLTFWGARVVITRLVFDRLRVTALLKEAALQRWTEDRQDSIRLIAQLPELQTNLTALVDQDSTSEAFLQAYVESRRALLSPLASNPDLSNLLVLRARDGRVLVATDRRHEGKAYPQAPYFQAGLRELSITALSLPPEVSQLSAAASPELALSLPLLGAQGQPVAVLVAYAHLDRLGPIVRQADGLGASGKAYLVNRHQVLVAGTRTGLDQGPSVLDSDGIVRTLRGEEGGALYGDYAGVPVIGYTRWLDSLELALLVEISQREAFRPARHLAGGIFLVGAASAVFLTGAVYLLARQITYPILAIKAAAMKVAAGDFTQMAPVLTQDEVGVLAQAFNRMTERLRDLYEATEQKLVQLELAEVSLHRSLKDLELEQAKSERLLLNTLPSAIAQRLLHGEGAIAEHFDAVTVLFADIVAFTRLSARLSPQELVQVLNAIFSKFDQLTEVYGLEKIKTIGDAYMVVGGLPEPRADHAEAIASMALAMQTAIRHFNHETGENFMLRVGIHSGPVVAGVIGLRKFSYDLWGDTVNVASRMESQGLPDRIQVTEATYRLLRDIFLFEPRGTIHIRGRGEMQTYFLLGRCTETEALPTSTPAPDYEPPTLPPEAINPKSA